ncbi:MAG: hypothetical protein SGJ27_16860 [Candidatus Melainabacteria bacterium]|nr:hypothetical protein [Candidatus Melainabacteria bacterium]
MKNALSEREQVERAELMQSVKALFIPLSLFLSCVIFSAGAFLLYNQEPAGWIFIAVTGLMAATAIYALVKFQNPYRAKGVITRADETDSTKANS